MAHDDRRLRTAVIALLLVFSVGASPAAPAGLLLAAEPPELLDQLHEAKVVLAEPRSDPSTGASTFVGYVVFDRPVDRVFALLQETSRQVEFRPDLDRVESVERRSDGSVDEHHVRVLFTDLVYRLEYRFDAQERHLSWRLDPGFENALRRVEGRWELEPWGAGRTLARFETSIEVGAAVPRFLEDRLVGNSIPTTLESCRLWVNADGGGR
jgi:hypothetical protein